MSKKILITGSNGLLGQKLTKLLLAKKEYHLIATSRGSNRISSYPDLDYHSLDITNEEEVFAICRELKPDIIVNTAAMTQVDDCESQQALCRKLNVEAVSFLVKACEQFNIHLVHVSTDFIFDGLNGPYTEEDEPNPVSYYGQSKLDAEKIVKDSTISWSIARTVLVYGITEKMSRSNIILWVKKSLEEQKDIQVVNDQWRTPTLAEDLAMGCFLLADQRAQGVFNISGKEMLTPYDIALETADFFKLDKQYIHETDGSKFTQAAKRPPKTGFDISKARRELGYEPHSFREGIGVLARQMNEQSLLKEEQKQQ